MSNKSRRTLAELYDLLGTQPAEYVADHLAERGGTSRHVSIWKWCPMGRERPTPGRVTGAGGGEECGAMGELVSGAWAVVGGDGTVTTYAMTSAELLEWRWWQAFAPRFRAVLLAAAREWDAARGG